MSASDVSLIAMQGFDKGFLAMFTRVRDQDYCHIPISIYQFDIVCRDCTLGIEGVRVCISMMGVLWIKAAACIGRKRNTV